MALRESTRLVNEQRQFRNGVRQHRCLVMRQQPKLTRYDLPEACRAVLDAAPPTITPAARQQLDASTRAAVAACEARAILALGRRLNAVAETVEYARCTGLDLETILWRATAARCLLYTSPSPRDRG